jgi:hypothetical protein
VDLIDEIPIDSSPTRSAGGGRFIVVIVFLEARSESVIGHGRRLASRRQA